MKKVIIICIMMLLLCVSNAPADSQALTDSYQVTIYEPVTAIPMAPTVIADGMTAPGEIRPATVLLSVTERGGALYTRNEAGEEALLEEQLGLLEGLAMPMLQIQDAATAQALRGFLAQKELSNAFVISDDAQLVGTVCNDNMYLRPVLDFPQGTQRTAKEICDAAYLQGINIVSIDQSLATQEMLYQLQQHYLTVFVRTSGDDLSLHTQILSGANGIITENWRGAIAALESYTDVTVVRPSHVIGHRGNPEYAPDNTLRSIASAAESGADIIEIDVRTTADGVLLMCHDKNAPVMGRTQYAVAETELSVLTAMELADARAESTDRLATLEEGLALIKESYPDIVVEIDLKDRRIETALAIRELAEKYDMLSNITLLSSSMPFNTQALALPMGCAVINSDSKSGAVRADSPGQSAYLVESNYRLSGGYLCQEYLFFSVDLIEYMKHLGVTSWIFTMTSARDMDNRFLQGYAGMTTNVPAHGGGYARWLKIEENGEGEKRAVLHFYDGSKSDVTENCEEIEVAEGIMALRHAITLTNKKTYCIYSLPYPAQ